MLNPTPALLRGRAAAESLMQDTCTVQHQTGETTDPETGVVTYTHVVVYSGKCKIQQAAPATNPTNVGEAAVFVGQLVLHLPMSVTGVQPDDLVTITASVLDPDLAGRTFRLRGPVHKSYLTARRFPMVEVAG
ncbi:hypothetical protein Drose_04170 [Dactylosporangium roseum]|uniref:Uncharacterized protein n=1 Tax=Dactylosporangium roseum TaxID=47989 RepID=A0ABY5Z8Z7_9ACTN|nr:DUF6093 family protein [Dactylosporangium roseum]UWZ37485.1 hypothetical protein Drose_04170 [Dactylosporangium roseum]